VREDGTTLPVSVSVTPRLDEAGETAGYLFVATDITTALEASRLKDEFVGLISHELRTPLTSILGYLELLREDDDSGLSAEQHKYLEVVERNAHRLLRLVGDLLFTAQVESGKLSLVAASVELADIVTSSVQSAGPAADAAGITVHVSLPDVNPTVSGDSVRLGQAVDNLLSNAIKFTPSGEVRLSLAPIQDGSSRFRLAVADTGVGFDPAMTARLFQAFQQADGSATRRYGGTGLGLSISRGLAELMGGTLDGAPRPEGGSVFVLELPLPPAASVSAQSSAEGPMFAGTAG
jgi:signal transduction histidine kinase